MHLLIELGLLKGRLFLTTGILISDSRQFKKNFLLKIRPPSNPHPTKNYIALYNVCGRYQYYYYYYYHHHHFILEVWKLILSAANWAWITQLIITGTLKAFP